MSIKLVVDDMRNTLELPNINLPFSGGNLCLPTCPHRRERCVSHCYEAPCIPTYEEALYLLTDYPPERFTFRCIFIDNYYVVQRVMRKHNVIRLPLVVVVSPCCDETGVCTFFDYASALCKIQQCKPAEGRHDHCEIDAGLIEVSLYLDWIQRDTRIFLKLGVPPQNWENKVYNNSLYLIGE